MRLDKNYIISPTIWILNIGLFSFSTGTTELKRRRIFRSSNACFKRVVILFSGPRRYRCYCSSLVLFFGFFLLVFGALRVAIIYVATIIFRGLQHTHANVMADTELHHHRSQESSRALPRTFDYEIFISNYKNYIWLCAKSNMDFWRITVVVWVINRAGNMNPLNCPRGSSCGSHFDSKTARVWIQKLIMSQFQ